jgi:hypothetical protein
MSDVRDLVGDLEPEELARLQRVHALLEQADPPPVLSPRIEHPPKPRADVIAFPRRYRYLAAVGAAAAAVLLFGFGYVAGSQGPDAAKTVAMSGPGGATGTLEIYAQDAAGNWPMRLDVNGLSAGKYGLWLTRDGRLAEPCGTFAVAAGETTVPLNAPYRLRDFDGWVVVAAGAREPVLTT